MYKGYEVVKIGKISDAKKKKVIKGAAISFSSGELAGNDHSVLMHPMNAKMIKKAQSMGKGVSGVKFSRPEVLTDIEYHEKGGEGLSGGSIWDSIKNGLSKAWNYVKDSGIGSILADSATAALTPALGPLAPVGRQLVRNIAGVGLKEKRLENLARARKAKAEKKINKSRVVDVSGGSFMIN